MTMKYIDQIKKIQIFILKQKLKILIIMKKISSQIIT